MWLLREKDALARQLLCPFFRCEMFNIKLGQQDLLIRDVFYFYFMKKLVLFCCIAVLCWACERDINFDLDTTEPKLVVEATIENGQPPIVILTNSLNYFSKISPQILAQSFVHNAEVFVSNGSLTHKLKEYPVPIGGGFILYYYSIDSSNLATAFTGQLNKSYSLKIVAEGKEYTATTTLPNIAKRIDSIFGKLCRRFQIAIKWLWWCGLQIRPALEIIFVIILHRMEDLFCHQLILFLMIFLLTALLTRCRCNRELIVMQIQ